MLCILFVSICAPSFFPIALAQGLSAANCSREDSRTARHVLQQVGRRNVGQPCPSIWHLFENWVFPGILLQYLFRHLGDSAGHLPQECPLHPGLDMFSEHERHKYRKNKDQHKCGYCGKVCSSALVTNSHMMRTATAQMHWVSMKQISCSRHQRAIK